MKRNVQIVLSSLVVICLTLGILIYLMNRLERKDAVEKYEDFYSQEESFDVLYYGSSHIINGVFPMQLWNQYGIVSYNMGNQAMRVPGSYWLMRLTCEKAKPKLIVLDTYMIWQDKKVDTNAWAYLHKTMDRIPLSKRKTEAVEDLLNRSGAEENANLEAGEMLFNYSLYHTRWSELTERDFSCDPSSEKGAYGLVAVSSKAKFKKISKEKEKEFDSVDLDYLCKFIDYCKENGIEVLLTTIPYPAKENRQKQYHYLEKIANQQNVNYLNFLDLDIVDMKTDTYDGTSHLNCSGARKVTDYLGKYIMEHYDIKDQRENEKYSFWKEDYNEYVQHKEDVFLEEKKLNSYLMLMYDDDFDYVLCLDSESMQIDETTEALFDNLGIDLNRIDENHSVVMLSTPQSGPQVSYMSLEDYCYNNEDVFKDCKGRISIVVKEKQSGKIVEIASFSGGRKKHAV